MHDIKFANLICDESLIQNFLHSEKGIIVTDNYCITLKGKKNVCLSFEGGMGVMIILRKLFVQVYAVGNDVVIDCCVSFPCDILERCVCSDF